MTRRSDGPQDRPMLEALEPRLLLEGQTPSIELLDLSPAVDNAGNSNSKIMPWNHGHGLRVQGAGQGVKLPRVPTSGDCL